MSVSRTRRLSAAGATVALAAAGLIAPALSAQAAPALTLDPAAPVAGSSFSVSATGLTANSSYRLALTGTDVADKTDRAESNSCATAASVTGTTLTCTVTETTGGPYQVKLLAADNSTVFAQNVTVNTVVALPNASKPVATDGAGTANDAITVTKVDHVSWKIDATPVTFDANKSTKDVALTPADPSSDYVVTATTDAGYAFADGSTSWTGTYRLTAAASVPAVLATPTAPVVIDEPGTADDAVRLTKVDNVTWSIGGSDVTWGANETSKTLKVTPDSKGNVTITAKAAAGRAFAGASATYDFVYPYSADRAEPATTRVAGTDRVATAVEVSKKYFPNTTETVYVANALNFPDALSAGPAAARANSPLLQTWPNQAPQNVVDEIKRLKPTTINIVGGESVVSAAVEKQLAAIAPVKRVFGADRYATAAAVSGSWAGASTVYLAQGKMFPDALSAGSGAAKQGAPLLLSDGDALTPATAAALKRLNPAKVVYVGGSDVLRSSVDRQVKDLLPSVTTARYAGADRYATSASVIENVTGKPGNQTVAFLASGLNFPDALAGVPASAKAGAPLALTPPNCLTAPVKAQLDKLPLESVTRLGGTDVLGNFSLKKVC